MSKFTCIGIILLDENCQTWIGEQSKIQKKIQSKSQSIVQSTVQSPAFASSIVMALEVSGATDL